MELAMKIIARTPPHIVAQICMLTAYLRAWLRKDMSSDDVPCASMDIIRRSDDEILPARIRSEICRLRRIV